MPPTQNGSCRAASWEETWASQANVRINIEVITFIRLNKYLKLVKEKDLSIAIAKRPKCCTARLQGCRQQVAGCKVWMLACLLPAVRFYAAVGMELGVRRHASCLSV